jgi:hypothetical protein
VFLFAERTRSLVEANSTITGSLYDMWSRIIRVLNDCTYRRPVCSGCAQDTPHECQLDMCVSLFAEGRLLEVTDSSGMTTSLMKMLNVWPVEGHRNIDAGARGWHISVRYRR